MNYSTNLNNSLLNGILQESERERVKCIQIRTSAYTQCGMQIWMYRVRMVERLHAMHSSNLNS